MGLGFESGYAGGGDYAQSFPREKLREGDYAQSSRGKNYARVTTRNPPRGKNYARVTTRNPPRGVAMWDAGVVIRGQRGRGWHTLMESEMNDFLPC